MERVSLGALGAREFYSLPEFADCILDIASNLKERHIAFTDLFPADERAERMGIAKTRLWEVKTDQLMEWVSDDGDAPILFIGSPFPESKGRLELNFRVNHPEQQVSRRVKGKNAFVVRGLSPSLRDRDFLEWLARLAIAKLDPDYILVACAATRQGVQQRKHWYLWIKGGKDWPRPEETTFGELEGSHSVEYDLLGGRVCLWPEHAPWLLDK